MAKNRLHAKGTQLDLTVASGKVSGNPAVCGQIPGVCLTDRKSDGKATLQRDGVFNLAVAAIDASGGSGADANVAVAEGDIIYYDATKTPNLSKRATGIRFGYAKAAVTSGATATIPVIIGY